MAIKKIEEPLNPFLGKILTAYKVENGQRGDLEEIFLKFDDGSILWILADGSSSYEYHTLALEAISPDNDWVTPSDIGK